MYSQIGGQTPFESLWSPAGYQRAIYAIVRTYRPHDCVEIGLDVGNSAEAILTALRHNGEGGSLCSVDCQPWLPGIRVGQRLARSPVSWKLVYGGSAAVRGLAPESYDLLYVDGGHEAAEVDLDLLTYLPGLRPDGILLMDDLHLHGPSAAFARLTDTGAWETLRLPCRQKSAATSEEQALGIARRRG